MATTDAKPVPIKGQPYRVTGIEFRDSDDNLITNWANADSEKSLDGALFNDCLNELTEIGTSGIGYLDLDASETNVDSIELKLTIDDANSVVETLTLNPVEDGDLPVDVTSLNGDTSPVSKLVSILSASTANAINAHMTSYTAFGTIIQDAVKSGGKINIKHATDITFTVEDVGDLSDAVEIWFVGKKERDTAVDAESVKISLTGNLLKIEGADPADANNGTITKVNGDTGVQVNLRAADAASLSTFYNDGYWAVRYRNSDLTVSEPIEGTFGVIQSIGLEI